MSEIKGLPQHSRLALALSLSLWRAVQTPPPPLPTPPGTPGSRFLPGGGPSSLDNAAACSPPNCKDGMAPPLTLSRPVHQNCLQEPSLGSTLPRAGSSDIQGLDTPRTPLQTHCFEESRDRGYLSPPPPSLLLVLPSLSPNLVAVSPTPVSGPLSRPALPQSRARCLRLSRPPSRGLLPSRAGEIAP